MSQPDSTPASPGEQHAEDFDIVLNDAPDAGTVLNGVHIRIDATVRQQIIEYAGSNTGCELGGVLIGTLREGETPEVSITAMIIARYTEAVQASITFTPATWQDIHEVKDRVYPDLRIVGWFHTHPGFGIFLSRYDMYIQEHFFDLDWQVAYVVDPVAHTEGFFRWENRKVCKTTEYEVVGAAPVAPATTPMAPAPRRSGLLDPRNVAIVLLSAAVVGVLFFRPPRTIVKTKVVTAPAPVTTPAPVPPSEEQPAWATHVVKPGESLWTIAERYYGDGQYYGAIMLANDLHSRTLYTGMRLRLPAPKPTAAQR